jgi:hypothetical protein
MRAVATHGCASSASEGQVAAELCALLSPPAAPPVLTLTVQEDEFLAAHGGIPAASADQFAELDARSAARAIRRGGNVADADTGRTTTRHR